MIRSEIYVIVFYTYMYKEQYDLSENMMVVLSYDLKACFTRYVPFTSNELSVVGTFTKDIYASTGTCHLLYAFKYGFYHLD